MRNWPALEVGGLTHAAPDASELLQAALVDYRVAAISEPTADTWHIFFDGAGERDRAADALSKQFFELSISPLDVPDDDWVSRSQADLRAVRVGNIVVAPPWDVPASDGSPMVVIIRPSMGFGTAHHATTRLCLAALQRLDPRGREVIDVGTGSGVLAIAASRLGAASVVGIDDDPDALQSAEDNLVLNRDANVSLRAGDARAIGLAGFDFVMANLTGTLLTAAAVQLCGLAKPGGFLVLSGLLEDEEAMVRAAYADCPVHNRSQEGEWLCITFQRP